MSNSSTATIKTLGQKLPGEVLIEQVYDTEKGVATFVVKEPEKAPYTSSSITRNGFTYKPFTDQVFSNGSFLLPSKLGDFRISAYLLLDLIAFFKRYIDLPDPFINLAARYCMLSWVFDRFDAIPYLRLIGQYGTGKSQFLRLCGMVFYHPINLGAALSPAALSRMVARYRGTCLVDEANFNSSGATSALTQILNQGFQSTGTITRCNSNDYEPQFIPIFGPKILVGHSRYSDNGLESRFITETSYRTHREDISQDMCEANKQAIELRDCLMAYRFATYFDIQPHGNVRGLEKFDPRFQQILKPLFLSLCETEVPGDLQPYLHNMNIERNGDLRNSEDFLVVQAIVEMTAGRSTKLRPGEISKMILDLSGEEIKAERISSVLRNLNIRRLRHDMNGAIYECDLYRLRQLADNLGVDYPASKPENASSSESDIPLAV